MRIIQGLLLALVVALCAIPGQANAQASVSLYCWNPTGSQATNNQFTPCNAANPLVVSASVSASITGFPGSAQTTGTPFTATTGGVTGTLPAGTEVVVSNTGTTNTAFCKLGASASVGDQPIPPNSWFGFTVGTNTQVTCITSASTTGINMVGGSGLPTGAGGGGGGGGSSGAVFGPTAVGSAAANPPVLMGGTANGTATGNVAVAEIKAASSAVVGDPAVVVSDPVVASALNTGNGSLATIASNTGAPVPAGTNLIGKVSIDQTTPGTTNGVQVNAALPAGTNVVGFASNDPCSQATKLGAPISLTASGQIITGTSGKKTYICAIDVVPAAAQNVALVEGTGTTCATNIFGLAGGTTAATGWNFSAGGGIARGSGNGTVYSPSADTNGTAANVCLLLSGGSVQVSGQITYVQQ